jgi:hypothetical protein
LSRRAVTGRKRAIAVRLGVFAILFQAILFGWHHHDLIFGAERQRAVLHKGTGTTQPLSDEDGCEICQVLHHQTLSSSNGAVTPLPGLAATRSDALEPVFVIHTTALAFRARAPPLA